MIGRRQFLAGGLALVSTQAAQCASSVSPRRTIRSVRELEEACRAGGQYILMPGTYVLGDKTLRPVSSTRISGIAGRTVLHKQTSPGPYRTRPFFDIEDASNVIIEDIEFRHLSNRFEMGVIVRATSPRSAGRVTVRNCVFDRCYVYIQRFVDGVTVEKSKFLLDGIVGGIGVGGEINKVNGKGLNVDGAVSNVRILQNYFEEARTEAIDLNWNVRDVLIQGNYCYNCNTDQKNEVIDIGGDVNSTPANDCRNIIVKNNKIVNDLPGPTSTIGIHVKGRSVNVILENNLIIRTGALGGVGIRIWNADNATVVDNTISGYDYGITTTDAGDNLPRRCRIANNSVRNYRVDGIELRGDEFSVTSNEVEGAGSTGNGIDLVNLKRSVIHANKIRNSGAVGIRARSPSSDLTITKNSVRNAVGRPSYSLIVPRSVVQGNTAEDVR